MIFVAFCVCLSVSMIVVSELSHFLAFFYTPTSKIFVVILLCFLNFIGINLLYFIIIGA